MPTRGAAESLARTLDRAARDRRDDSGHARPDVLTRAELYARLHEHLSGRRPMLTEFEREVLFRRAARTAAAGGAPAPFSLRAGLVIEILAFYDELRRRHRTVADFDRLMTDSLLPSVDFDRGAERMMRQTRFLSAAFEQFDRLVRDSGSLDEHQLRAAAIAADAPPAYTDIVVTSADQPADPMGLWTADFDMLARLPGVERIDVIATENVLASGFHQRVHDLLPGIEETRHTNGGVSPVLVAPEGDPASPLWHTCRDREEELADVIRRVKTGETQGRVAIVFQRPLPYLYLARNLFADAGLEYEATDALPLAAEPFAAALDLIFTAVVSEATRSSLLELLRSPHWQFTFAAGHETPDTAALAALDSFLQKAKYLGGWGKLAALADESTRGPGRLRERAGTALATAVRLAARLETLGSGECASGQIRRLLAFIREFERVPAPGDPWYGAHMRARVAILDALEALAEGHARHDDGPVEMAELAATVRRWIEGQTFSPRTGSSGVALLDASAAAYATVDDLRIAGLVDTDWPEKSRRNIFYPPGLLSQLGWPPDSDRLAAARARFHDLLRLARMRVSLSTFTLESDAIVSPSPFLEEIETSGLRAERRPIARSARVFAHEALAGLSTIHDAVKGAAAEWLALRSSRNGLDSDRFRGSVGVRPVTSHAVSHLERYLECPFKYFAQHVLDLDEERDDESVLTPQERGQLLHEVFERFFSEWHRAGRRAITGANLPEALSTFEKIADARLARLSEADRGLERNYLLGSAASAGLAERAFAFEIEHGIEVLERLLEYALEGEFDFKANGESRRLRIRAKADRIDLLADGTLRIIDYKLSRAPKSTRALQLPVYGVCAQQHLSRRDGRLWTVSRAGYVAFREKNAFVALGGTSGLAPAFEDGQQRLLATVGAIERGEFPVDPDEPFFCTRCGFSAVCRKDYVGDE